MTVKELILALFSAGCIKFGEFKLKSGIMSPICIDLRILVSFPELLAEVGRHLGNRANELGAARLAGIPFAGLPLAVVASQASGIPMIYPRPPKAHGTGVSIEGLYEQGDFVVEIDDVITDGASKIESARPLLAAGLFVPIVLVVIDREQGGKEILSRNGFELHSITTITHVTDVLYNASAIDKAMVNRVTDFLTNNQLAK